METMLELFFAVGADLRGLSSMLHPFCADARKRRRKKE